MGKKPKIIVAATASELARDVADHVAQVLLAVIKENGTAYLVLSGGETPRSLYRLLAKRKDVDWNRVRFLFGDERCVRLDHARSNFRMTREALLDSLKIPEDHVLPMQCFDDPIEGARRYEEQLRGIPRFDLVHLGLGEDGHTASLFPGSPVLEESERLVRVAQAPDAEPRMTLTPVAFQKATRLLFLITGKAKAEAVRDLLDPSAAQPSPGRQVLMNGSDVVVAIDRTAASLLTGNKSVVDSGPAA